MSAQPLLPQIRQFMAAQSGPIPSPDQLESPAAVLLALVDRPGQPGLILTKRAEHLSSHSGEVSLPGGKWDVTDDSLLHTALRESEEEVGLKPAEVDVLGSLAMFQTGLGVDVVPFVGVVEAGLPLVASPDELDAVFEVPLEFFLQDRRLRTDHFKRDMGHLWSPAYEFDGFEIWGFTARLLVDFFNLAVGADLQREHSAPVKRWYY